MVLIDEYKKRQIKEAADIVSVLQDFLQLKKSGIEYTALCPFHGGHHYGTFMISPKKNFCRCFSCGAQHDPIGFLMHYGNGMSYVEALTWLAQKYGIPLDGAPTVTVQKAAPREILPELPLLKLPVEWVSQRMYNRVSTPNNLVNWMRSLPWPTKELRERLEYVLQLYGVGTSDAPATRGWTIFWQVDELKRVHTGKLMKYKPDGHRDKEGYSFNFIHSMLRKQGKWSDEQYDAKTCLFGLHLLDRYRSAEVCLVESEKSAIIAQTLSVEGTKVFMATGSKSSLSRAKLQPIIDRGRNVVLYPDVDGLEEWTKRVDMIGYNKIIVTKQVRNLYAPGIDDPKSDIADIMVRRMTQRKEEEGAPSEAAARLASQFPAVATLIDKLKLQPTKLRRTLP